MANLSDPQKRFIVRRLACFARQVDVIAEFEELYKIKLTPDQVSSYGATTEHGRERMGQELQDLFHETREAYLRDEEAIPLAQRAFRVNYLTDMLLKNPKVARSVALQMKIIEQAAKEMGGMYVRHKIETDSGANTLEEIRKHLGVPLTAAEAGPIEAAEREKRRQEDRAREDAAAAEEEARLQAEAETEAENTENTEINHTENGDAECESS